MNQSTLLNTLSALNLSELTATNLLQDNSTISDNCVAISDMAESDTARAIEFLEKFCKA